MLEKIINNLANNTKIPINTTQEIIIKGDTTPTKTIRINTSTLLKKNNLQEIITNSKIDLLNIILITNLKIMSSQIMNMSKMLWYLI